MLVREAKARLQSADDRVYIRDLEVESNIY